MKYLFVTQILLACSFIFSSTVYAEAPSKQSLLSQWEESQQNNPELKSFNKVSDDTYAISFHHIPFEGNIHLININIEELTYETTLPINYMGVIEMKLPDKLKELEDSYSHSFHRWKDSAYFYYDVNASVWLTGKEYSTLSSNIYQTLEPTKLTKLTKQYSGEMIIGLIFIFIIMMSIQLLLLWKIQQKITYK